MEIPQKLVELMEAGNSLEFLLAEVELLALDQKKKDDLAWEVEEAKIVFDLEKEKARNAMLLIYASYVSFAMGFLYFYFNRISGSSNIGPILTMMGATIAYINGRNLKNKRITIGRDRLLKKGYFKRF